MYNLAIKNYNKKAIIYFKCLIADIKTITQRLVSADKLSYSNLYDLLGCELNLTCRTSSWSSPAL